jgi:hypothetical protein
VNVASHQACFLPWAGLWARVLHSEKFVLRCGYQYTRAEYQNRVKFPDSDKWATIPLANGGTLLKEKRLIDPEFPKRIRDRIYSWARKRPYKHRLAGVLETLSQPHVKLWHLNTCLMLDIAKEFEWIGELVVDLDDRRGEAKADRFIEFGPGAKYLAGPSIEDYLDPSDLEGKVSVYIREWVGEPAQNCTVLDLLSREKNAKRIIMNSVTWRKWA